LAAIEKVCEFSGDYPGPDMYAYKRASIQVCPQYRKEFKGQKHVLFIFSPDEKYLARKGGRRYRQSYDKNRVEEVKYFTGSGVCIDPGYGNHWIPVRTLKEYYYLLYVPDLLGQVDGEYINWSYNIGTVRRKLKRLLGSRTNLLTYHSPYTWEEWCELSDEERVAMLKHHYDWMNLLNTTLNVNHDFTYNWGKMVNGTI
jgi:hypothetical protein